MAFDSVVKHWPPGVATPTKEEGWSVDEMVDSLFRIHSASKDAGATEQLEALKSIDELDLLRFATMRIVSLGNEVAEVKRKLRPRKRKM